jgi:hypothetical protein
MNHYDGVLNMYSENGLRTVEDWTTRGRDVESGAKPRVDTPHRGQIVSLYSRDQTQPRPKAVPKPR